VLGMRELNKDDLNNLPKKYGIGANKNKLLYDWVNCVGYIIRFIYDDIQGIVEIIEYNPRKSKLKIQYLNNKLFDIATGSFLNCLFGGLLGKKTNEFKIEIGKIFNDNKRDIEIIDREYRENPQNTSKFLKWYQYKCNNCGYNKGWIVESNLFQGIGCACCGYNSKTTVEGINDIPTTAPWMVKYFQGGYNEAKLYTKASTYKLYPICPDCGRVKDKQMKISNIYVLRSIGCPCGDGQSYPNKFMYALLEQIGNAFYREYAPEWIKPKRYDFYFELYDKKYIVEMDGAFHNKSNSMNGKTIEQVKTEDKYKDNKAYQNNIQVIRINAEQSNIEHLKVNILESELNNLFDLKIIDWKKCEEFAISNLCKKVCDVKNENPNITVDEIANLVKLERSTIINYLNKGTKLNWCYYNGKEENRKIVSKIGLENGKQVEVFKGGNSLGIFKSCQELERKSEEIFGTKLFQGNISKVITGERKHHKGYTFKFILEV
jgi:hypothetical protein